jgi:hypothetical protein
MKKQSLLYCLLTLGLFLNISIFGATKLKSGDIAIVQINYSNHSFDFVPLVPLATGTKIVFTDMKYSATSHKFIPFGNTNYGLYTYTAPAPIGAGVVIQSKNNPNFVKNYDPMLSPIADEGLTIIAFQKNDTTVLNPDLSELTYAKDTTFLTALGWYKAVNFKAGESDIPPGLDVLYNSVVKLDSTDLYYIKYRNFKFDDMGISSLREGTAIQLRRRFADKSNFIFTNGTMNNTPVSNFNVLAPDLVFPTLVSSNPNKNKINVSPYSVVKLKFSEPMIAKNAITIRNTQTNATQYISPADVAINDTIVSFSFGAVLDYAANYTMEFQPGTFTDLDNNPWPAMGDTIIPFATSAKRGQIDMRFMPPGTILLTPFTDLHYYKRDDIHWTTQSTYDDYGNEWWKGFFSFNMFGLPYRWYGNVLPTSYSNNTPNMSDEESPVKGYLWMQGATSKVVVDLTGIDNTITNITSTVYDNNCAVEARYYFGGVYRNSYKQIVSTPLGEDNQKIHFENINTTKLDSIVFSSLEGNIQRVFIELVDLQVPIVELGANRTICEGDSVKLDGGFTPGAVYDWSTNEHSKSIWVKNTGNYSLTVKNTLGQRSDNVSVTVKPKLTVSLPDTIYACVGDTVTLTAGTDISNSYFWTPNGQTTPSIKVIKSGIYHVLVNNGFGGCFTTDSTRVIFKGAKVRLYNYQGGSYGSGDVKGQLYRKNSTAKFELYREMDMLDFVQFDSLAAGEYIFKMHFVGYSFVGQNPWMDTYHDGKTEWKKVTPFKLTCETDSMIGFLIASKPSFVFNGTGVISGKVNITGQPINSPMHRAKTNVNVDCETRVVLYNATGDIIATTCPDANGNYSFTNLPAGNYTIGIERTGFEVQSVFTTTVTAGATISNADFTINQAEQTVIQGISTGISNAVVGNSLKLIPNPAVNTTMLEFDLAIDCNVTISVSDLMGRVIQKDIRLLSSGKNRIPLAVDNLSGIFIVKVSTVAGYSIARLIVQ